MLCETHSAGAAQTGAFVAIDNHPFPFASSACRRLFSFSFPGFGNLMQQRYATAFMLILWELFINTKAHINTGILYSLLGDFEKAKAVRTMAHVLCGHLHVQHLGQLPRLSRHEQAVFARRPRRCADLFHTEWDRASHPLR